MAERISQEVREKVIRGWLQGRRRDEISIDAQISSGSVSNIIRTWQRGIDSTEYSAVRDLAIQSRKCGMSLNECALSFRLIKLLTSLGLGSYEKIEMIVTN